MTNTAAAYLQDQSEERLEIRVPRLLKAHLAEMAKRAHTSVSSYVLETLAERVAHDVRDAAVLDLTLEEQAELLKVLAGAVPAERSDVLGQSEGLADTLFGPATA